MFDAMTCFHYLFEDQASVTPSRPAIACRGRVLTYRELNGRANQVAAVIRKRAGRPQCVALLFERSTDMVAALLGVMKAGSAYVPLQPETPPSRLLHQIAETGAPLVITQTSLEASVPQRPDVAVVCIDRDGAIPGGLAFANPRRTATADDLAYVIYTSGSTGSPKGVAVRHDNLVNYTTFLARTLGLEVVGDGAGLHFATVSTLAADLGNTSIFASLATGGCLHVIDRATTLDGHAFAEYVEKHPIDVLKITPSHLNALMACGRDVLPRGFLITGGEASDWRLLDTVRRRPGLVWINHYGPTETTIGSLTCDVRRNLECRRASATVPIGDPIANTTAYVLDDRLRPVRRGAAGELYIGGRGVAAGYFNQPELTRQRFLDDPFSALPGARMYKTGDRVRQLANGAIEFLGRVDRQVKIRGFRVELGEVEAALRRRPEVRQAAVVPVEDRPGGLRLVAYVVALERRQDLDAVLRTALATELPSYMVPSAFVTVDALPLTANGKIDHQALASLIPASPRHAQRMETPDAAVQLEDHISAVWREVLAVEQIGWHDNFFEVGGDSLRVLHLLAGIERVTGMRLAHATFLEGPSIAATAAALRRAESRQFASLVVLHGAGTRPPIFCVHGGGGHCYYYRDLARRLGPDQPFYGLQARHVDGRLPRQTSVEEMAQFYLAEVQQVAPKGPYYLAGASFGGKVALEMAHILRARGEQVALVAMFDTWGPGYPHYTVGRLLQAGGWWYRRVEHHLGSLRSLDPRERGPYLRAKIAKTIGELHDMVTRARARAARALDVRGAADADEGFIAVASRRYRPRFYPGKVVLFRSRQQPLGIVADRTLGWSPFIGDLEIHDVRGLHAAAVAEPRVRYLVEKLVPCLERARSMATAM